MPKKWYSGRMETQLKAIVAQNLIELRKCKNMTQSELGEKLNYSDKTISKWENGDSSPDLSALCKIAGVYGVSLDDLVKEGAVKKIDKKVEEKESKQDYKRSIILGIWISVFFLVAALVFVYLWDKTGVVVWQAFVWAVPVSCLMLLLYGNKKKDWKRKRMWILTLLSWSLLLCTYLQLLEYDLWLIFIVGAPIQVIIWLSSKLEK